MNYRLFAVSLALVALQASSAFAQEADPFAAYEGRAPAATAPQPKAEDTKAEKAEKKDTAKTQTVGSSGVQIIASDDKDVVVAKSSKVESAVVVEEVVPIERLLEQNHFFVGLGTGLSFDKSDSELYDGTKVTNSSFFTRIQLELGYVVYENVTLELNAGSMWRRFVRSSGDYTTQQQWVFKAKGWYTIPVWVRAGITAGVGLGGYFGSGEQKVPSKNNANVTVDETTNLAGFALDMSVGITYIFGSSWQLRILLNYDYMVGKETIPSLDKSLFDSSMHFGMGVGVNYVF